jgi:hypothetical protein
MHALKTVFIGIILGLLSLPAYAIPSNFYMEGVLDEAEADNVYGLSVGQTVTVTGMFDAIGTGLEIVSFHEGSGNMLEFQFGSKTFNETDDWNYQFSFPGDPAYPLMTLMDGGFVEFDYVSDFMDTAGYFDAYNFITGNWTDFQIGGNWDASTYSQRPKELSEPGTLGLMLIGLAIAAIRRQPK